MEWTIIIAGFIAYLAIGGFINGLSDFHLDGPVIFFWPLYIVVLALMWICDIAEDLGCNVREFFKNRKGV